MNSVLKSGFGLLLVLLLAGCVSTTTSQMSKKKDLVKAEKTYVQIGFNHISEQNYPAAKRAFERALAIDDTSAGSLMGLGIIFGSEDEPALAEKKFAAAIRYDESQESRFQYAIWRYNEQDYKKAYSSMLKVTKDTSFVRRASAYDILGLLALRMEKPQDAIVSFKKAITLNKQLVNSYINLSNTYMAQNEPSMAYDTYMGFTKLVQLNLANQSPKTLWLGIQLASLNNDKNAASSYGLQLKEIYPDSEETKIYLNWKKTQ